MKNWTYTKKNSFLAGGIILLLVAGYFLSFSKTIALSEENDKLRSYEGSGSNLPLQIAAVNRNIQRLDSLISLNEENYQARLLGTLSEYCHKNQVTLMGVEGVEFPQYENTPYETYHISIEGRYTNLIRTIADMENNYGLGKIQSVRFETETERRSKKTRLILRLYLTRVIVSKNKDQ